MTALGTTLPAGSGTGYWRTYDTTDGLAGNMVLSTYQNSEGHLWIVTHIGISRFDGKNFTTFTLPGNYPHNNISPLLHDKQGNLWLNTHNGLSRFDGTTFTTYTTKDGLPHNDIAEAFQDRRGCLWLRFRNADSGLTQFDGTTFTTYTTNDGLPSNHITAFLEDQNGTLWIGTQGGLVHDDRHQKSANTVPTFTTYTTKGGLPNNHITTLIQSPNGHLWIGTDGGLTHFDRTAFTVYTSRDGLPHDSINQIYQDTQGHLWITVHPPGNGLTHFNGKTFTTYTAQNGLLDQEVKWLFTDRQGHLWIGTLGGLNRFDGKTLTSFTTQNGLSHNNVQSIFEDVEGHLWVGTYGGLCQYIGNTLTTFTTEDGLPNNDVWAMLEDRNGHLWFGTNGGGVSFYNGKTFTTYTTQDGLPHDKVLSIFQDRNDHLWFGTRGGACQFDGITFTIFTTKDGLPTNTVWKIAEDKHGHLWFGTNRGGVSRYDGHQFTTFSTQTEGSSPDAVWEILEDREGTLWLGTHYHGACRFDGQVFRAFAQDTFSRGWICTIIQDMENNLWFGTQHGGVVRYDGHTLETFTRANGLADNWVCAIIQDREGHFWFGTSGGGVSHYDGQIFQTITQRDGLAGNVVYSILQDKKGDLWFGTNHGVTRYHPSITSPPPVFIEAVVADRRYQNVEEVEISDSTNLTAFEYHAMSFKTRPQAMVYQYRLNGYETDWKITDAGRVEYQGLPLGEYTFEVRAIDQDLTYSQPTAIKLKVESDPRVRALIEALSAEGMQGELVGTSTTLRQVEMQLSEVAHTNLTVLILGETGTGKGVAARAVHAFSTRKAGPLILVNCGAIPEGLVESELFGHERGAFTGATFRKMGKVELAKGGTLFLDEVGDLSLEAQAKLLRLLEERSFERVGGTKTMHADVRVIAATNRDLVQMVEKGTFREDLYFRLNTFPVRMPPLRERREDIPLLTTYFMERMNEHLHKPVTQLTPNGLAALQAYDWPGNVRELEHAVQRAMIVCQGPTIHAEHIILGLGKMIETPETETLPLEEHVKAYERRYLQTVLEKADWVIRGRHGAATMLGVPESTLRYRMKKLGIQKI